jgi:tRNA(Arg) A34 adenosine deaminase TadA
MSNKTWTAKKWICKITAKIANTSSYDTFKHGSVIAKGGRILGKGVNQNIRKKTKNNDSWSIHAEESAIRNAGKDHCKGATIYVARQAFDGLRNSKPCNACAILIKQARIKQVIFSLANDSWGIKDP